MGALDTVRPTPITRQMQIDFTRHNIGIKRARAEYEAHPIASCPYPDCPEMVREGSCCDTHWRALVEDRERKRVARRKRREGAV